MTGRYEEQDSVIHMQNISSPNWIFTRYLFKKAQMKPLLAYLSFFFSKSSSAQIFFLFLCIQLVVWASLCRKLRHWGCYALPCTYSPKPLCVVFRNQWPVQSSACAIQCAISLCVCTMTINFLNLECVNFKLPLRMDFNWSLNHLLSTRKLWKWTKFASRKSGCFLKTSVKCFCWKNNTRTLIYADYLHMS